MNNLKKKIEQMEKEVTVLKDQLNNKYEPMEGEWVVCGEGTIERLTMRNYAFKDIGRVFDTEEKAKKARDIMVRHDIILKYVIDHASDFEPDWGNFEERKWFVNYDWVRNKWVMGYFTAEDSLGMIVMPQWVAEKLVDDLNNGRIDGF